MSPNDSSTRNPSASFSSTHSNESTTSTTSTHSTHSSKRQEYVIANPSSKSHAKTQADLSTKTWIEPYTIDDADLTFDGKPLNLLYEENRYRAEHAYSGNYKERSRGRSRQSKK